MKKRIFAWIISAFSLLLFLILAEGSLRLAGFQPGVLGKNPHFKTVESLYLYHGMEVDSAGIMGFSPQGREVLCQTLAQGPAFLDSAWYGGDSTLHPALRGLVADFGKLDDPKTYPEGHDNAFNTLIDSLRTLPSAELDSLEQACLAYAQCPVNEDGFFSIAFDDYPKRKKILLLGDSFTYGHSARPLTASFPNILLAQGYAVYNTGISAVDPVQYLAVAKQYISRLRPDVVIVNFFHGNDIIWFVREPLPGQFEMYPTNAGNLWACPRKAYLESPQKAYDYIKAKQFIPLQKERPFHAFCAKSVIGTRLWMLLKGVKLLRQPEPTWVSEYDRQTIHYYSPHPVAQVPIGEIRSLAEAAGSAFFVGYIPDKMETNSWNRDIRPEEVFSSKIPYFISDHFTQNDFRPAPDGHFNNRGHRRYAAFLDSLIKLYSP